MTTTLGSVLVQLAGLLRNLRDASSSSGEDVETLKRQLDEDLLGLYAQLESDWVRMRARGWTPLPQYTAQQAAQPAPLRLDALAGLEKDLALALQSTELLKAFLLHSESHLQSHSGSS